MRCGLRRREQEKTEATEIIVTPVTDAKRCDKARGALAALNPKHDGAVKRLAH